MSTPAVACALAAALLAAAPALAQDALSGPVNLFISPCGEPFYAAMNEAYPIVKWFAKTDLNHDGRLTPDEFKADADQFFKVLDQDHNGYIDSQEINVYEQTMVPQILGRQGALQSGIIRVLMQRGVDSITPSGAAPGDENVFKEKLDPNQGAVSYSLFREPEPVRSADRNFDYRITLQEFEEHAARHFAALDVDGKGFLLLADLPKTAVEKASKAHR